MARRPAGSFKAPGRPRPSGVPMFRSEQGFVSGNRAAGSFRAPRKAVAAQAAVNMSPAPPSGGVPDGSTAFFDFAGGAYWTQAAGDLTLAEVISDTGSVEPGVGYRGSAAAQMIGDALAAFSSNATYVLKGRVLADVLEDVTSGNIQLVSGADDPNTYATGFGLSVSISPDGEGNFILRAQVDKYDSETDDILDGQDVPVAAASEFRFNCAYTLTPSKESFSIRGGAFETLSSAVDVGAIGVIDLANTFSLNAINVALALESITIYPAKADADLPGLSALA